MQAGGKVLLFHSTADEQAKRTYRVLIADDSSAQCQAMETILLGSNYLVVGVAHNGVEACAKVAELSPDILLLDIVMPMLDGPAVLDRLRKMPLLRFPRVVVLSGVGQEPLVQRAMRAGADGVLYRPFSTYSEVDTALSAACGACEQALAPANLSKQRTSDAMRAMGISPHMKGYGYLLEAVALVTMDVGFLSQMLSRLYPEIARRHGTLPTRVERDIRHVIESAWTHGNMEAQHLHFGYTIDSRRGKPTNAEFIAMMAEQMRIASAEGLPL